MQSIICKFEIDLLTKDKSQVFKIHRSLGTTFDTSTLSRPEYDFREWVY